MYTRKAKFLVRYFLAQKLGQLEHRALSLAFTEPYDYCCGGILRDLLSLVLFHFFTNYTKNNLLFRFDFLVRRVECPAYTGFFLDASFLKAFNELRQLHGIEAGILFDELKSLGVELSSDVTKAFKRLIEVERNCLLRNIFRELSRLKGQVKALSPPLLIIPKSLHPVKSLAH
jgi:hypothetical protein